MSVVAQAEPQLPKSSANGTSVEGKSLDDRLNLAAAKFAAGDAQGAYDYLAGIAGMPDFAEQTEDTRFRVYLGLGFAESALGKAQDALEHLELAKPLGQTNPAFWQMYMLAAGQLEDFPKAIHAAAILASRFPEISSDWADEFLFALLRESRGVAEAQSDRMVLLDALWRNEFKPEDSTRSMDGFWIELLNAKLAADDTSGAASVASTLHTPDAVRDLTIYRAYEQFAPESPAKAWQEAAEGQISMYRDLVGQQPELAKPSSRLGSWLTRAGRPAESLIVLDAALKRIDDAPRGVSAYDDQAEYLAWLHNGRAIALLSMGLWDQAVQAQEESFRVAQAVEAGSLSQAVNMAEIYLYVGQFDRAVETARTANPDLGSAYGQMSVKWTEACANKMAGRDAQASEIVDDMVEMATVAFPAVAAAIACVRPEADAAQFLIDSLDNEATREDALQFLQRPLLAKSAPPAYTAINDRVEALRQREDVLEAVAEYGRIVEWPFFY